MKFVEITAEDFRKYAKKSPYKSFMQTPEIGEYRAQNGWTSQYFAVIDDKLVDVSTKSQKPPKSAKNPKTAPTTALRIPTKSILAASLVVSKPTFLSYQTFYAPGGPLLDLEDTKLTNFFFRHLIAYAKDHNGYALRVDPYYELIERDREGEIVSGGFNHQKAKRNLEKFGFRPSASSQPRYLFATSVGKQTPDELLAFIKHDSRNTFRNIQKATKMGVRVRELTREELPILKQITASTAERRHFQDPDLSYYEQLYDLFAPRGEVKFMVAEADIDGRTTPLSSVMFMLYGDEVISLFGGNASAYLKTHSAQYLLQWEMLSYAITHGFKRYNFYGLNALPQSGGSSYGIYNFKRGFGGQVIELIGTFELPLNTPVYHLHSLLAKLKHLIHHQ